MRTHGTPTTRRDDRGFGVIEPAAGGPAVFVHISAFPRDGRRPALNESVSYEVETGPDGKTRAVRVMRPAKVGQPARPHRGDRRNSPGPRASAALPILLLIGLAVYGYVQLKDRSEVAKASPSELNTLRAPASFRCDGRTHCSQMTSCAEARHFIRHCPNTQMDGDGDGEPCEQQWCR